MAAFIRIAAIPCALWALVAAESAQATTWNVPLDASTVADALTLTASGDTVRVDCGVWVEHDLRIPSGVTLCGASTDPACTVLDARGVSRVIDVVSKTGVRIESITIKNGTVRAAPNFQNAGGGVRCDSSEVTLSNCILARNYAELGAGLASRASTLTIQACHFVADSAISPQWSSGGGLYAIASSGTVTGCSFDNNGSFAVTFPGDGGGVFVQACGLLFTDCTFTGNGSGVGAAAFYSFLLDHSQLVGCSFSNNYSPAGGAVYVEAASPTFSGCTFTSNTAQNGGAMLVGLYQGIRATPIIEDCVFEDCKAIPFAGGAILSWHSSPVIQRCRFRNCVTGARGAAVAARGTSNVTLTDCLMEGNSAQYDGGAVWSGEQSICQLTRCTLRGNASVGGGTIGASDQSSIISSASIVAFATSGKGASCSGSAAVSFVCSDVFGNAGGDWVGCIAGQAGSSGNFSADPLFCPSSTIAALTFPDSPCLPANAPCGGQVGSGAAGCGCPADATIRVPDDYPTIAAALAAAVPGDVVGVCAGEWPGGVVMPSGVRLVGVSRALSRVVPDSTDPGSAVLSVGNVADSTVVADLTLDGRGLVPQVVLAESTSTGLHLVRDTITGGAVCGVVCDADSWVRIGGSLSAGCDLYGNGGATPKNVQNGNVAADSLDATYNWWGSEDFMTALATVEGPVSICPITNATHDTIYCLVVGVPHPTVGSLSFEVAPNPFRGTARFSFAGSPGTAASLRVYDVAGRRVRTLRSEPLAGPRGEVLWDSRDDAGRAVAPGVYFVRLESGKASATRKIVLVR
ncbi:MAG: right-handed parallel beta-helix repeat-containing protein [bacterium]